MKIERFSKQVAKVLGDDVIRAVTEYTKDRDVSVSFGGGKYSDESFTLKIEFRVKKDGKVVSQEETDYAGFASYYLLPADGVGKRFEHRGNWYTVRGLLPRNSKFPVLAERVPDGKKFKFPADAVKRALDDVISGN